MKLLLLPVCLAAVTAAAAELQDPARVAAAWNRVVDDTRTPLVDSGTLTEQVTTKLPMKLAPLSLGPGLANTPGNELPAFGPPPPDTPLYDAPTHRPPPRAAPREHPPGAKAWEYRGEIYWLVPLSTPVDR